MEKLRIVVVEDEYYVRKGIIQSFDWEKVDCEIVGEAANGKAGIEVVEETKPDLVIVDVEMPVMDGLEATRRIRAMKRPDARTIPIIAMTANAFAEDRQLAFAAGMDMHIAKPLEGSEMVETLERLVKSSRK